MSKHASLKSSIDKGIKMVKSKVWSAIATLIAIPVWLLCICLWMNSHGKDINSAGVIVYMGILLIIGIPLALFVSFVLAPSLSNLSKKSKPVSFLIIMGFHWILLLSVYIFYFSSKTSDWVNLLIIAFYLLLFLTPPSFVGCTVYLLFSENKLHTE